MKTVERDKFFLGMAKISCFLGIGMLGIILLVVLIGGIPKTDILFTINETMDTLSIIILVVIMYSTTKEIKRENELDDANGWYLGIISMNIIGLFSDFVAWRVQGIPRFRIINHWTNFIFYLCAPCSIYTYWKYVKEIIEETDEKVMKVVSKLQIIIAGTGILAVILNNFFGFYFSVGLDGVYRRTANSFVYHSIPNVLMVLLICFMILRSRTSFKNKVILILYELVPSIAMVFQIFWLGISLSFICNTCMILAVYTNIQTKRSMELMEQKIRVMQSQLQPHFIYNGMLSIRSLIKKSPEEAITALDHFMGYLRGSIDLYNVSGMVSINQELRFVKDYLEIEKVRFGEKIQYEIIEETDDFMIPPITIQPLVENAIRHGIRKKADGRGKVEVRVYDEAKSHVICVVDDGVGFELDRKKEDGRTHIGVANTRKRLRHLLRGTLEIESKLGIGTRIEIRIPR